jgi:hypothetical protein
VPGGGPAGRELRYLAERGETWATERAAFYTDRGSAISGSEIIEEARELAFERGGRLSWEMARRLLADRHDLSLKEFRLTVRISGRDWRRFCVQARRMPATLTPRSRPFGASSSSPDVQARSPGNPGSSH